MGSWGMSVSVGKKETSWDSLARMNKNWKCYLEGFVLILLLTGYQSKMDGSAVRTISKILQRKNVSVVRQFCWKCCWGVLIMLTSDQNIEIFQKICWYVGVVDTCLWQYFICRVYQMITQRKMVLCISNAYLSSLKQEEYNIKTWHCMIGSMFFAHVWHFLGFFDMSWHVASWCWCWKILRCCNIWQFQLCETSPPVVLRTR